MFIAPEGDHYRTRLTHTLEVSAIARTVARALALNEDLVEAVAMGHDLGHAPFGHAGEHALDELLQERFGRRFQHNVQSRRVVEVLERDGAGLNLTREVRDGIEHHTGRRPPADAGGPDRAPVDRIAYVNHDIEDAIRAGVLRGEELPPAQIAVLGPHHQRAADHPGGGHRQGQRPTPSASASRRRSGRPSCACAASCSAASTWPRRPATSPSGPGASCAPCSSSSSTAPTCCRPSPEPDPVTRVTDHVSGMTDRYALRAYREAFLPREGPL